MEMRFARRMDGFEPGIFNVLDEKKNQRMAQGKPVYNLSIGTPDFLPEGHIVEALAQAASDPANYRYSLGETAELTQAVRGWYRRRYGVELDSDELMAVYGSQEGLTHVGWTLCDPGDVVLVPDPGYPIFELGPYLCGADCVHYPLLKENNYLPDLEYFDPDLAKKARFMVVSYPANPLGAAAPDQFYPRLIEFARRHDIVILHDNAYSEIIFDGRVGKSFLCAGEPGDRGGFQAPALSDRLRHVPAHPARCRSGPQRPPGQRGAQPPGVSGPAGRPVRRSAFHRLGSAGQSGQHVCLGAPPGGICRLGGVLL